jgi:hypothetical protein
MIAVRIRGYSPRIRDAVAQRLCGNVSTKDALNASSRSCAGATSTSPAGSGGNSPRSQSNVSQLAGARGSRSQCNVDWQLSSGQVRPEQRRAGSSSSGREFRSVDWNGWRDSFKGSGEGRVAPWFERSWLRMGGLVSAGRILSRQRAALLGVVRSEDAKKGRSNKALQQNRDHVLRY